MWHTRSDVFASAVPMWQPVQKASKDLVPNHEVVVKSDQRTNTCNWLDDYVNRFETGPPA